ncbi:MAG: SDR family NAD(P)-dependent oxidoreductase [Bacteroidota bacterium]|jgi:short-subunit dehydrogenase|nr:SDR family oxidoreductase [Cytophagales bacterium]
MKFALITGASGGIGLCIARELAKRKNNLLLIARSTDKLKTICSELEKEFAIKADYLSVDLSNPLATQTVVEWLHTKSYAVDTLVNNAGYGLWGRVDATPADQLNNMMQLNMNAVVNMCHAMLPELKKQPKAYIMNIASTAAYQAVPTLATYAASKAFVVLFTRGLRRELKESNISVTCVSPGATTTNFIDRAGMEAMKERAEKFSMAPEAVASIAVNGMLKGKAEVLPGFTNWFSVQLTYFVPKFIPEKIAEGLYKTN